MGTSQSSNTSAQVPIKSVPHDADFDPTRSGVRITGSTVTDVDEAIQQAYKNGKEEGALAFQSSLESLAAQVYDNVHTQLSGIQAESIEKSKNMAEDLKAKLAVIPGKRSGSAPCGEQELALAKCLQLSVGVDRGNSERPASSGSLACAALVNAYSRCAINSS